MVQCANAYKHTATVCLQILSCGFLLGLSIHFPISLCVTLSCMLSVSLSLYFVFLLSLHLPFISLFLNIAISSNSSSQVFEYWYKDIQYSMSLGCSPFCTIHISVIPKLKSHSCQLLFIYVSCSVISIDLKEGRKR